MSKGNMLLGHARGKVGSLVFSRANGQQITRARAEQVKNPRTEAQMVQRIILNTVAQAYSRMASICDHSFEGIKNGQDSMSYYMKRNTNRLRAKLAEIGDFDASEPVFVEIGKNYLANIEVEIAKGSLPQVNPLIVSNDGIELDVQTNTYKAIIDKYGLQRGDQLTFCAILGTSVNNLTFKYCRVILDPKNVDGSDAPLTSEFIAENTINKPNNRNELNGFTFSMDTENVCAYPGANTTQGAVIASREKEDGTWLRSNSLMLVSVQSWYGENMKTCLDNFYASQLDIENPRFLNNAKKGFKSQQAGGRTFTVNTSASPSAGGSATGSGRYEEGAQVTVVATPNSGYRFVRWTENGSQVSTSASYSFYAAKSRSLIAVFQSVETVSVTTSSSPAAGGNTSGGGNIEKGTSCTVVATPNSGYKFKRWTKNGTQVSTSASYTFTANATQALVAEFEEVVTVAIATSSSPAAGGSTSGGGNIEQGTSCTIVATPASGYQFVKWTENGADVSTQASYTFTANAAHNFVAVFEEHAGGFSNVTIAGTAWNADEASVGSGNVVAGSVESAPSGAKVWLAASDSRPSDLSQDMCHGTASVSNNQFSLNASNISGGAKYWLVCFTGNADDGFVIAFTYEYYAKGAGMPID